MAGPQTKKARTNSPPKSAAVAKHPPTPAAAACGANALAKPLDSTSTTQGQPNTGAAVAPEPGAATGAAAEPTPTWSLTKLLEMDSIEGQNNYILTWSHAVKSRVDRALLEFLKRHKSSFHFDPPADVMSIPALAISDAAAGATLTSFREIMNYDNLQSSFRRTGQYEAAGTVWMLDPCPSVSDESVSVAQIEAARWQWSEEVFLQSHANPDMRRFSFDIPLPARMQKTEMAQRKDDSSAVIMSAPLPMIAGKAHVLSWYSAVDDALQEKTPNHQRIIKLFEAALSVPIRLRLCPTADACALASLQYAESAGAHSAASGADSFWLFTERVGRLEEIQAAIKDNISAPKLLAKLKAMGITFKGKSVTEATARAMKSVLPFVADIGCKNAYLLSEVMCPEIKDQTMLMRLAGLCSKRGSAASGALVFLFDGLRVGRLTGEFPKGEGITVSSILGQEKKSAGWADIMFKKQNLVEFLMHEAELIDKAVAEAAQTLSSPTLIAKRFSATGEDGLVGRFLNADMGTPGGSMNECFAVQVAEYRDAHPGGPKVQQLLDLVWGGMGWRL